MANAALRIERLVAIVFAICLIGACAVHMADLLRHGWLPYRFAPLPLNVYWTSLTFFDALAAVLLLCSMRIGLFLTLAIISSDVALNLFARFGLGLHLHPLALLLQILFFIAVVGTIVYAQRNEAITRTI
jgi:membrane protein HdeD